jgi:tetratricopeptide (TPR) repeat protein
MNTCTRINKKWITKHGRLCCPTPNPQSQRRAAQRPCSRLGTTKKMNNINEYIKKIEKLVAEGDTESAITELSRLLEGTNKEDFAIILSSRYNNINQEVIMGKIKYEDKTIHINILNHDILKVIETVKNKIENSTTKNSIYETNLTPAIFHEMEMFLHTKKYEEAIALSTILIDKNHFVVEALINRGAARFRLNDFYGALEDFTKALKIEPNNIPALKNRGICFFSLDRIFEAKQDWLKIQELGSFEAEYFLPLLAN